MKLQCLDLVDIVEVSFSQGRIHPTNLFANSAWSNALQDRESSPGAVTAFISYPAIYVTR